MRSRWRWMLLILLVPIGFAVARAMRPGVDNPPATNRPAVFVLVSFEKGNPFNAGTLVADNATEGKQALRVDKGFISLDTSLDWTGYDFLKTDVFNSAKDPLEVNIEVKDRETKDYWTRVNITTVVPPGPSTLTIPTALYVGEKSRPGRPLILNAITRLVFALGDAPKGSLTLDNIRLERDTQIEGVKFPGLWAFDVGPAGSPVMEGFTALDPNANYTKARGHGWKNARIWRNFNALQPDPLYQDFICVEKGGLAIDVPNGLYHVFVNMDSPSGYWGEVQKYHKRALLLEGHRYEDEMTLESFKKRYFRYWDVEDRPGDNTFDKYQLPYFQEKHLEVEVLDGQLNIEFEGSDWACCVSAIIAYPESKKQEGEKFLDFVRERRRFHFDNTFKQVRGRSASEEIKGVEVYRHDWMSDTPMSPPKKLEKLVAAAFQGEMEPLTVSIASGPAGGTVEADVSDLHGQDGAKIPASAIDVGYVVNRLSRVTMEGSVYTIAPKYIMPRSKAPTGDPRTFWLTVKVPPRTPAGLYRGEVQFTYSKGGQKVVPIEFQVLSGTLDPVDIPVGPWGHTIDLPWFEEEAERWNETMAIKSLRKLREYGFTTATGLPMVSFEGFKNGVPQFDTAFADRQMRRFREAGFTMPVVTYCAFHGLDLYSKDEEVMRRNGFNDYSQFLRTVFGHLQRHAEANNWLPVYWNIGDEPIGDDLVRSAENAEAYRKAFPKGPPYFTAASSFEGTDANDPHYRLSKALHVANWNVHDRPGIEMLQKAGGHWAFYNGGNRWTYGVYMYKAAKEHGMKFRVTWHWNVAAGDPYYALDCREDDYAWCSAGPNGELIPSIHFERLREGLDDYRRMLTLSRLCRERPEAEAAKKGTQLLSEILGGFALGDRELKGVESFDVLRTRLEQAIVSFH